MKRVRVSDFRQRPDENLEGHEPLSVEDAGRVVGYYVPARGRKVEATHALDRIEVAVIELIDRTGLSTAEVAEALESDPPD